MFWTPLSILEAIRADFPALSLQVNGHPLTYLDNAASAQKPRQVLDRMVQAYESEYSNVHRGLHYLANAATEGFEHARETVRAFLNAASVDEIIFTRSGTGSVNLVASSLGQSIGEGDEIILSIMEHHSNIVPGTSCGSARARSSSGRRCRKMGRSIWRPSRRCSRRARRLWPSPTCPTCWAP